MRLQVGVGALKKNRKKEEKKKGRKEKKRRGNMWNQLVPYSFV